MTVGYLMSYLKPFYPAWDDARASELLRQFDLPLDRKLKHLSRGMWMKTALASSLAYRPSLIVLDEPFTGLDPLVRDELIEGVLDAAEGATILISSHDLAEIETFASHIGYLDRGRLQFSEEMTSLAARFREIEITFNARAVDSRQAPVDLAANRILIDRCPVCRDSIRCRAHVAEIGESFRRSESGVDESDSVADHLPDAGEGREKGCMTHETGSAHFQERRPVSSL